MNDFNPLWITVGIGAVAALVTAGIWIGSVNSDRKSFKEFMAEARKDIKKILGHLEPEIADNTSPLRLNDLGKKVSTEIGATAWADRVAPALKGRIDGMGAYDIQEFCFTYTDNEAELSDEQQSLIKQAAFNNGLADDTVRRVMAFELRDRLLDLAGLEPADEKEPPSPLPGSWDEPQQRRGGG